MPTITAGRPADANELRSYDDILAAHRDLCRKAAASTGDVSAYNAAASLVWRLGVLYRRPTVVTDEMRTVTETALAAIRDGVRTSSRNIGRFEVAATWMDHLDLLVRRPTDGR